jgi:hypothetical protein
MGAEKQAETIGCQPMSMVVVFNGLVFLICSH